MDRLEERARELCLEAGQDPDETVRFLNTSTFRWTEYIKYAEAKGEAMTNPDKLIESVKREIQIHHDHELDAWTEAKDAILAFLKHEPSEAAVEAVARAMYGDSEDIYEEPWDSVREDAFIKVHYRSNAKVAIKANADHLKAELEPHDSGPETGETP